MTLDRYAAERRRFARLLGVDEKLGSGLPIGGSSGGSSRVPGRDRERDTVREQNSEDVTERDRAGGPRDGSESD